MIQKMQSFELSQIHHGGYVQFLHLLSQILVSNLSSDERLKVLPPTTVMADIIGKIASQSNEKEVFKIISGEDTKAKKIMLYKFFFFCYLLSVTM